MHVIPWGLPVPWGLLPPLSPDTTQPVFRLVGPGSAVVQARNIKSVEDPKAGVGVWGLQRSDSAQLILTAPYKATLLLAKLVMFVLAPELPRPASLTATDHFFWARFSSLPENIPPRQAGSLINSKGNLLERTAFPRHAMLTQHPASPPAWLLGSWQGDAAGNPSCFVTVQ